MQTSSFFVYGQQPGAISIARWNPKNYKQVKRYPKLAPTPEMMKQGYSKAQFESAILGQLNPETVYQELHDLADGYEPILLCYEKPGEFCHRRIVADWLHTILGVFVPEYEPDELQSALFGFYRTLKGGRTWLDFETKILGNNDHYNMLWRMALGLDDWRNTQPPPDHLTMINPLTRKPFITKTIEGELIPRKSKLLRDAQALHRRTQAMVDGFK